MLLLKSYPIWGLGPKHLSIDMYSTYVKDA